MASSYISRLRIKLWLSAMEFWALVRRTVKLLSTNRKAQSRFLASSTVAFLVLAVLALVAGGSNEPYAATMMENQGKGGFKNNPRFIDRELHVNYGQGPGKIVLMRRMNDIASSSVHETRCGVPPRVTSLALDRPKSRRRLA
jgi:hypothetical protein